MFFLRNLFSRGIEEVCFPSVKNSRSSRSLYLLVLQKDVMHDDCSVNIFYPILIELATSHGHCDAPMQRMLVPGIMKSAKIHSTGGVVA